MPRQAKMEEFKNSGDAQPPDNFFDRDDMRLMFMRMGRSMGGKGTPPEVQERYVQASNSGKREFLFAWARQPDWRGSAVEQIMTKHRMMEAGSEGRWVSAGRLKKMVGREEAAFVMKTCPEQEVQGRKSYYYQEKVDARKTTITQKEGVSAAQRVASKNDSHKIMDEMDMGVLDKADEAAGAAIPRRCKDKETRKAIKDVEPEPKAKVRKTKDDVYVKQERETKDENKRKVKQPIVEEPDSSSDDSSKSGTAAMPSAPTKASPKKVSAKDRAMTRQVATKLRMANIGLSSQLLTVIEQLTGKYDSQRRNHLRSLVALLSEKMDEGSDDDSWKESVLQLQEQSKQQLKEVRKYLK
jgi:hypothetical protein